MIQFAPVPVMSVSIHMGTSSTCRLHSLVFINLKVQVPMILAAWVKPTAALRALASTLHILIDGQHMLALATQHRHLLPQGAWPDAGVVWFGCVVASNARVELVAAKVLDGNDVERRMPVCALCEWCD